MTGLRAIVLLVLMAFFMMPMAALRAQGDASYPQVNTSVNPTSGTVGEHFNLRVSATVPDLSGLQVLPLFDTQTTWTELENARQTVDSQSGADQTRTFNYTIVPFETGRIHIPRVAITYSPGTGETSNTVLSEALWVDVNSVLSGNGSASALRDVKPPIALPVPPAVLWTGGVLLLLLFVAVAYLLWRRYSSRLKKLLGRTLTPPEVALKEMAALENERLIESKKIKEFYTRLSDAVRHYLEQAYGVSAMDLTTNELLRAMDEIASEQPYRHAENYRLAMAKLVEIMDEADLVKFARLIPEVSRCRRALQSGRDFVALTSYRFVPEEEQEKQDGPQSPSSPPGGPTAPPPPVHAGVSQ